jgi:hypothetical protein
MGAGHSGSTILGVTLGNCEGVFYAGEVEEWLVNAGSPHFGGTERTRFWQAVGQAVGDAGDLYGGQANRYIERASAVFRVDRWLTRRRLRPRYRQVNEELFQAIAQTASATHVVDTSHFPMRARELQRIDGIDLYLLFLSRDPRRVVASELRHISRHDVAERRLHAFATNARLWLTLLVSTAVFLRQDERRRLFVRHEDFLSDPQAVVRDILDLVQSPAAMPDLSSLSTGVPLIGNKLIRSEFVSLRTRAEAPLSGLRITGAIHAPWAFVLSRLRPATRTASR